MGQLWLLQHSIAVVQSLKLHGLIESKQLKLLQLQRRLRGEVSVEKWIDQDASPTMLVDWSRMRRARPGQQPLQLPRHAPQPPKKVVPVPVPTPQEVNR